MALPGTSHRVSDHTAEKINKRIADATKISTLYYRNHPDEIRKRLDELDHEWDIERALETNASAIIVINCALGFAVNKMFFAIPLLVGAFLLQHALQGWCPPLPILRRLGFRTCSEIEFERRLIENLVGDINK